MRLAQPVRTVFRGCHTFSWPSVEDKLHGFFFNSVDCSLLLVGGCNKILPERLLFYVAEVHYYGSSYKIWGKNLNDVFRSGSVVVRMKCIFCEILVFMIKYFQITKNSRQIWPFFLSVDFSSWTWIKIVSDSINDLPHVFFKVTTWFVHRTAHAPKKTKCVIKMPQTTVFQQRCVPLLFDIV